MPVCCGAERSLSVPGVGQARCCCLSLALCTFALAVLVSIGRAVFAAGGGTLHLRVELRTGDAGSAARSSRETGRDSHPAVSLAVDLHCCGIVVASALRVC